MPKNPLKDKFSQKEELKHTSLIGEFMEIEVIHGDSVRDENNMFGTGTSTLRPLRYRSSWDELIPVLSKIKEECSQNEEAFHNSNNLWDALLNLELKKVYKEVVHFIYWYNQYQLEKEED